MRIETHISNAICWEEKSLHITFYIYKILQCFSAYNLIEYYIKCFFNIRGQKLIITGSLNDVLLDKFLLAKHISGHNFSIFF